MTRKRELWLASKLAFPLSSSLQRWDARDPSQHRMAYLHEPTGMEVAGRFAAFKNIRRDIKSALSSFNGPPLHAKEFGFRQDPMKEEQTYERLLQALGEMQRQIAGHVRPVAKQIIEAEVERLRNLSQQQKSILNDCFTRIDRAILDCRSQMDEYRQRHSALTALNKRLACLGVEPMPIPDYLPAETLGDLILARVQGLRVEGKI